jgi:hypothetical protein
LIKGRHCNALVNYLESIPGHHYMNKRFAGQQLLEILRRLQIANAL